MNERFQEERLGETPKSIDAYISRHHRADEARDIEERSYSEIGLSTVRPQDVAVGDVIYLKRGSKYFPCRAVDRGGSLGLETIEQMPSSIGGTQLPAGDFLPMQMFDPNSEEFYVKS
ncbi:MAG: hypothetical protein PHH01_04140 [Patescibacteria group bacterium]|nr:hypothetical protein [Patescibacteria group bacterium]